MSSSQVPTRFPSLARSALTRVEGLGDNCELGFVLRRLGAEDGMLFRWASIRPESLLATLRGDFDRLYEFADLVPENPKMVRDLRYGTAWHSEMHSTRREGVLAFDADAATRRAIHAKEGAKLAHLVAKLRRKFEHPDPVFVIKANAGVPETVLEAIHYQLYRRATSPRFALLEVCADPVRAGTVEVLDRNRLRGFVARFAPYDRADEGDDASWRAVLAQALAHGGAVALPSHAPSPGSGPEEAVVLPFPTAREPALAAPIPGDLRGGMPRLLRGNEWCRLLDDCYRLHASGTGPDATALCWSGVHLAPGAVIALRAGCAIAESEPVRATLRVSGATGEQATCAHVFAGMADHELSLPVPPGAANPMAVTLTVEPVEGLRRGERAVIDVHPIRVSAVGA